MAQRPGMKKAPMNLQTSTSLGAVLGALIGDAAGGTLEFLGRKPSAAEVANAMRLPGGGVFQLAPGQFTDDGEMTVTLLRTLNASGGAYEPDLVATAYCEWANSRPFDIGNATSQALRTPHDQQVSYHAIRAQAASVNSDSKANGSLMRATPLGRACPRFCVNGLMAGNCLHLQRKRNDRKQRTDRPPVGGLQKT